MRWVSSVFTPEGEEEYKKYEKWLSDENFQFSPNFVPTPDTPSEAVEYYKDMYRACFPMIDFDAPDFTWPVGIGISF